MHLLINPYYSNNTEYLLMSNSRQTLDLLLDLDDDGGYDFEYLAPPQDNLICKVCLHPSRNPHKTLCCGHVFCRSCVIKVQTRTCPVCRAKQFYQLFKDKQVERDVWSLRVFCTNKDKGCSWQGELSNIVKGHLKRGAVDGCQYEDVKCTNGCGDVIQRRHFTRHITKECPYRRQVPGSLSLPKHSFTANVMKIQCPIYNCLHFTGTLV